MQVSFTTYIWVVFGACIAVLLSVASAGTVGRDHFAAISAGYGPSWYQDLGGDWATEIQDQDIFFHNIGHSIDSLRKADVVIVGSSLVAFAINGQIAKAELEKNYGLKFYNMAFVGIASGEFTKRVIMKYQIHPKLWIINADDGGGGGNFFGTGIQRSFGADVKTIAAAEHGRLVAFKEIVRRNLRWRAEAVLMALYKSPAVENSIRTAIPRFYRDAETGDHDMSAFPKYNSENNGPPQIKRDPGCHTTPAVIGIAKNFVRDIGGEVMLTVIPNTHYCEQQAHEIAAALGIELVLAGKLDYSSWDQGGHYDRRGSTRFTRDLLTALEKTRTFQRIANSNQPQ